MDQEQPEPNSRKIPPVPTHNEKPNITLAPLRKMHLPALAALFHRDLGREPNLDLVASCAKAYPAAVLLHEGNLVGFAYSRPFAPDILELLNILVAAEFRSLGVGSLLLHSVEAAAADDYEAMILVNSDAYPGNGRPKKPATNFYLANGYQLASETSKTRVFWRSLRT